MITSILIWLGLAWCLSVVAIPICGWRWGRRDDTRGGRAGPLLRGRRL